MALTCAGDSRGVAGEDPAAVVVPGAEREVAVLGVADAGEGPLRVPPGELPVVEPRLHRDPVPAVLGDPEPVVDGVGGAGRDEPHVGDRPSGPGVPLVDRVAPLVEHQAAVEVRPRLDRAPPPVRAVLGEAGVEDLLPVRVDDLELDPHVERVHRAAREEVADPAGPHHDLEPRGVAAPQRRVHLVERGHHLGRLADEARGGAEAHRLLSRRERRAQARLAASDRAPLPPLGLPRHQAEHVDRHRPRLQEGLGDLQLLLVAVDEGERGVGPREAVRVDLAVPGGGVLRGDERHVAVGAALGLRRVVEGAGSLPGDAGGLPVVVLVEAADPAVGVHRHVEVDLVARGAELRGLVRVEALQERARVGAGVELQQVVVARLQEGVLRGREVVQRRVLDREITLSHRALDVDDRVAGQAAEAGLGLGSVDLLADRGVELPGEEHGVVVAAGAPLRRLRPHHVLHVLDGLAVPLVVERREVVGRCVPLVVDVLVAAGAVGAVHEEVRGHRPARARLPRRGEERSPLALALSLHGGGGKRRVHDGVARREEIGRPARSGRGDREEGGCGRGRARDPRGDGEGATQPGPERDCAARATRATWA